MLFVLPLSMVSSYLLLIYGIIAGINSPGAGVSVCSELTNGDNFSYFHLKHCRKSIKIKLSPTNIEKVPTSLDKAAAPPALITPKPGSPIGGTY